MSGITWHIFTFGAIGICLIVAAYRVIKIKRLPIHLRWELAPIPHEKGKNRYGGSYLEEYEWWNKSPKKTHIAPVIYMAKEIFLLKAVWENNKKLWPFAFSLHIGIYLVLIMLLFLAINAVLMIFEILQAIQVFLAAVASVFAFAGYLLGIFGSFTLIIKRVFDVNLRLFSSFSKFFNLFLLLAIFLTGGFAWIYSSNLTLGITDFIKNIFTLNSGIELTFITALHIGLMLFFLIYSPFTDMIHPVMKYFTYHDIRWNDAPQNKKMEEDMGKLLSQPVSWSADHIKADGKKNWVDIATAENVNEKES